MFAFRRKAVHSAARAASRSTKRYSSAQHGKTGDEVHHFAGTSTEHGHHHAGPENESFGKSLYFILAGIPFSIGVYKLSRPNADGTPSNPLSRIIGYYTDMQDKWMYRAVLHTDMIEQAAFDRNLFHGTARVRHVDLKFPEIFNTGSPYNVVAGHGGGNLEQLVKHYEKLNAEAEEKKIKRLEAMNQT